MATKDSFFRSTRARPARGQSPSPPAGDAVATAQKALPQIYPADGWVEHDPEAIWSATVEVCRKVLGEVGVERVGAIGITNQRETTVLWDKKTGKPIHNAIVWQDRRGAPLCKKLVEAGHEPAIQKKTGLLIDSYFSATKIAWLLENVAGARDRAEKGELAFGTIDSFLLWRLTGGKVHATDITNACRTMLFDIHRKAWDADLLKLFGVPPSLLPEVKPNAGVFGHQRNFDHRRRAADRRHGGRPAGGRDRPGLSQARHDQEHLWHRLLCAAEHRQRGEATRRTGCSPPSPISSATDLHTPWKAASSSPARRCNGYAMG